MGGGGHVVLECSRFPRVGSAAISLDTECFVALINVLGHFTTLHFLRAVATVVLGQRFASTDSLMHVSKASKRSRLSGSLGCLELLLIHLKDKFFEIPINQILAYF